MPQDGHSTAPLTWPDPSLPRLSASHVDAARPRPMRRPLRVLALASYPEEAAATR